MKLTEAKIKNAKQKEADYRMFDGFGLHLLVSKAGSKYWRWAYRYNGKQKVLALGQYPYVSLADARKRRYEAKEILDSGIDPASVKKKNIIISKNIFSVYAYQWLDNQKGSISERYLGQKKRRLELDILPYIGDHAIDSITPKTILDIIKRMEDRDAIELSKRALQMCAAVFDYAIAHEVTQFNPCHSIKKALKPYKSKHYNSIDFSELPDLIKAINQNKCRLYPATVNAIKLLMLTFVRTGELIASRWSEFNFETKQWHIPAERMKMKRPHIVPLSRQAIEILREQRLHRSPHNDYVFASVVRAKQHMSNNTILKALERLGYGGKMTGHGFRSLAMTTIIEQLKYREKVPDLQLAHAEKNAVMASYNRSELLDERTQMMQDYADLLDTLLK